MTAPSLVALAAIGIASAAEPTVATLYACEGTRVTITYSTTGATGSPTITYRFRNATISRAGDDIGVQDTVLGPLVTIVVRTIPDLLVETLSLVAPTVNLSKQAPEATIATRYFRTRGNTTIGGPDLVSGPLQESTSRQVTCRASAPPRRQR